MISWTSSYTETGSFGAPELATAEKGKLACEHAVDQLVELVRWIKDRPVERRREHHAAEPTFQLPFGF
jgi:creatinine amidohydrolase/Fe(II)-dependent formamide hydrolase-like protein